MLGGIGKGAGLSATQELHKTVAEAIPAAQAAARDVEDHGIYGLAGIVADIANRLHGTECPVDLTITVRITGKVGALKLTTPEYS